ncbi:MAG: hypothetical protein J0G96_09485 [Flavobacteriia bacterium]|nr:hypothetical protein [Flavobacteriia bacterium]OJX34723.1 MAG: hypothetical protein BGO87_08425 [Flavobacteriia bacterium 40-80]
MKEVKIIIKGVMNCNLIKKALYILLVCLLISCNEGHSSAIDLEDTIELDFQFNEKHYLKSDLKLNAIFSEINKIDYPIENDGNIKKKHVDPNLEMYYKLDELIKVKSYNINPSIKYSVCFYFKQKYCIVIVNAIFEQKDISDYRIYLFDNDVLKTCLVKNLSAGFNTDKYYTITNNINAIRTSEGLIKKIKYYREQNL